MNKLSKADSLNDLIARPNPDIVEAVVLLNKITQLSGKPEEHEIRAKLAVVMAKYTEPEEIPRRPGRPRSQMSKGVQMTARLAGVCEKTIYRALKKQHSQ
jgi:hypothetical protein